jgi:two-component system cell cycle response regulator
MIENLDRIIKKNHEIPTIHPIADEIIKNSYSKSISIQEFIKIVSSDLVLTSQVLKIVNSTYFNHPRSVNTIDEALVILGIDRFQRIILALALYTVYSKTNNIYRPEIVKIWKHAFLTGLTIRRLSEINTKTDSGELYFAGLLHDIGKILLVHEFGTEYLLLIEKTNQENVKLIDLEKNYFGYNHCEIGEALLRDYNLPENIVLMVRHHHAPEDFDRKDSRYPSIKTIYLSNILAHLLEMKKHDIQGIIDIDSSFEKIFQFTSDEINDILNLIRYDVKEEQEYIELLWQSANEYSS